MSEHSERKPNPGHQPDGWFIGAYVDTLWQGGSIVATTRIDPDDASGLVSYVVAPPGRPDIARLEGTADTAEHAREIVAMLLTEHPPIDDSPMVPATPTGPSPATDERIVVRCMDGQTRHAPFVTMAEAQTWAWWGHACAAEHDFETLRSDPVAPVNSEGQPLYAPRPAVDIPPTTDDATASTDVTFLRHALRTAGDAATRIAAGTLSDANRDLLSRTVTDLASIVDTLAEIADEADPR